MMKNKIIKYISVLFFAFICFTGCEDTDEFTGDSQLEAVLPSVSTNYTHGSTTILVETDASYPFTVSIAEPVSFDVVLKVDVISATATQGEDFQVPNEIIIAAGATSGSASIDIFADEIIEDQESFALAIGNRTINGISNPILANFVINNLTTGDLAIGLDWAASSLVTDNAGNETSPYDLADLTLLVSTGPNNTDVIGGADGGSAESYVLEADTPDGEYYIVSDFWSASDLPADIDYTLTFDQVGVINHQTHTFSAALNTLDFCADLYYVLAKVTKSGNSYTFEEVGEKSLQDQSGFVGSWTGEDMWGPTEMTISVNADNLLEVTGIGVVFMNLGWGEIITNQENLLMDINPCTGEVTIEEQYYMTTTYNGAIQDDYYLSGTGTFDSDTNTIDLQYDFIQAGTSYVDWLTPFGYVFHEINTLQD